MNFLVNNLYIESNYDVHYIETFISHADPNILNDNDRLKCSYI